MTRPVNRPHKPAGRKRKAAPTTISTAAVIEALAAAGVAIVGIAKELGTGKDQLYRWLEEDPELAEAFARGRESERYRMHQRLYRMGMAGDSGSLQFLLRTCHQYRDKSDGELGNSVNVTLTLADDGNGKVIEHEKPRHQALAVSKARTRD